MEPGQLQFKAMSAEVNVNNFFLRGQFTSKGDFFLFLNDLSHATYTFENVEMIPLSTEYQVHGIKQKVLNINRDYISFLSILDREDTESINFLQAAFPVVVYTEWFAILGDLHVHGESHFNHLLDSENDFFGMTDASIHPVKSLTTPVTMQRSVPFMALNRKHILAYHIYESS